MSAGRTFAAILIFASASGCAIFRDPMTMAVVRSGRSKQIDIILDSPEVRQMVALAEARQHAEPWNYSIRQWEDYMKDPEKYSPGRQAFFEAMDRAPHISVAEGTRVHVVEISGARCDYAHPEATITFVRAIVLNGSSKAQRVWICRNPYSPPFESP